MEQFKIPVDVQVEDKIVGPLTFRQLVIVGIGGGIAYFFYIFLSTRYFWEVWVPPVFIVAALTLAFAFVKINDMTFFKFILATIGFNLIPRKRIWKKGDGDVLISVINPPKTQTKKDKNKENEDDVMDKQKKIEELTKLIDSKGKPNSKK